RAPPRAVERRDPGPPPPLARGAARPAPPDQRRRSGLDRPPRPHPRCPTAHLTGGDQMRRALLGVDLTPTFCEGGGLPVDGGNDTAARVASFLDDHGGDYDLVVFSEDWHIDPGEHWATEGTDPDFATTWPKHGPAGTDEAR